MSIHAPCDTSVLHFAYFLVSSELKQHELTEIKISFGLNYQFSFSRHHSTGVHATLMLKI